MLSQNVQLVTISLYSTGKWVNCQVFFPCGPLFYGEECSSRPSYTITMLRYCRQNQGERGSRTSNRTVKVIIQYRPKNYEFRGHSLRPAHTYKSATVPQDVMQISEIQQSKTLFSQGLCSLCGRSSYFYKGLTID